MFSLCYSLTNKHNIHRNEKFRFCTERYSILPFAINLNTGKLAKHSLSGLVEAKLKGHEFSAKVTFMSFGSILGTRSLAEVPIGEDNWSNEGPGVQEEAHPAGTNLDPHS